MVEEQKEKTNLGRKCQCGHYKADHHFEVFTDLDMGDPTMEMKNCLLCSCEKYFPILEIGRGLKAKKWADNLKEIINQPYFSVAKGNWINTKHCVFTSF